MLAQAECQGHRLRTSAAGVVEATGTLAEAAIAVDREMAGGSNNSRHLASVACSNQSHQF